MSQMNSDSWLLHNDNADHVTNGGGGGGADPSRSQKMPPVYSRTFELAQEKDGLAALQTFEDLVYSNSKINSFQKDEIIRIISAHCLSSRLSKDNWYAGLALIGFAQLGEENLTMGLVYSINGSYPAVDIDVESLRSRAGPGGPGAPAVASSIPLPWDSSTSSTTSASHETTQQQPGNYEIDSESASSQLWQVSSEIESYDPISNDVVKVTLVPHREGIFMFRHVVYTLEGTYQSTPYAQPAVFKVVRRYSDFLWLLECLVRRCPFRLIPNLPPKRLTVDGKYLSVDNYFLELRRRGLSRFINQVMKHPILRKEKFVAMFLTVDTDLSSFRRQAYVQLHDEFTNFVAPPQFIRSWDEAAEMEKWKSIYLSVEEQLTCVTQLCHILDRISKRQHAMRADHNRMSVCFNKLSETLPSVYRDDIGGSAAGGAAANNDSGNVPIISAGLRAAAQYSSNASDLLKDEGDAIDVGVLEDMKQYRDLLWAMKEIFVRYGKLGKAAIPQLEKRVASSTSRLAQLQSSLPEANPADIERVENSIKRDKQKIEAEKNRCWLIRQCITEELILCQKNQYQISKILRDWSLDNTKYSELYSDNWSSFNNVSGELPLSS